MRMVDLSHEIRTGMPQRFAGPIPTIFDIEFRGSQHYQAVDDACILQHHLGTHIDSPRHYNPAQGMAVHQLPLEKLITHAVVLDLTQKAPLTEISVRDLEGALAKTNERINPGDGVLIHVGMDAKYDTWQAGNWRNAEYIKAPYLGDAAVQWLLAKQIAILGLDALAPDVGEDYRPVHQVLLRDHGIPIIENLCNLDKLTKSKILLVALPPKIVGAGGFPVRAVAIEE